MKDLRLLETELRLLLDRREKLRGLVVPSQQDAAAAELDRMAGAALGRGGLETMLQLVRSAMAPNPLDKALNSGNGTYRP